MSNTIRVGIGIEADDTFWVQVYEAIYQRSFRLPVKLIPINQNSFFSTFSVDEGNAVVDEVVSRELDVLLGWRFPESLASTVLEIGLPIVHLFETRIQHPLTVSPIGLKTIAEELAHYLARLLGQRGTVLVIGGMLRDELPDDGRSRMAGIETAFRCYPDIHFHHLQTDWIHGADSAIRSQLAGLQYPIDAIFGLSDSLALLGRQVALEMGSCEENVPVVGINGDPLALAAIIEGHMTATVETPAIYLANQAFDIALKIASGQPYPAHYGYNPRMVTAANVSNITSDKLVAIANIPSHLINHERSEQLDNRDYLETSLAISRQIGSVSHYENLSVDLAGLIRTNYGYDHVQLFFWSELDQTLALIEDTYGENPICKISLQGAGVLGEALRRDKAIFIPDSQRSRQISPDPEWPDTRSRVILPIRMGGKVLGLLDLHAFRVIHCTQRHLVGLQSLADQIGISIHNAHLYHDALREKAMAEKANQLKSRLLANISHELRNPLHTILSYSDYLNRSANSVGDPQRLQTSIVHLLRLVNDLLDWSRTEIDELPITLQIIEPAPFLTDVFESIAGNRADSQRVCWKLLLSEPLPSIQVDPDRLHQILLNLLYNAEKFTDDGEIILGAQATTTHFHIWVQDTGIGIPIQEQQNIFEPFYTRRRKGHGKGGVGLGLSITRRLVELHKGFMSLESQPGKGSTFHVFLPFSKPDSKVSSQSNTTQPILLLISDRDSVSSDLDHYCQEQHLEQCLVRSPEDLDAVLKRGLPTAIAWDASATGEHKWQLIERLHNHPDLANLPFLLCGRAGESRTAGGTALTSILTKPVKPVTLLGVVNSIFKVEDRGTILIVDDDVDAGAFYQSILTEQFPGYTCRTASSGSEGIALMNVEVPHLVIVDLLMPEVDGFEVIHWMRTHDRTCHVPITVLSGKRLTVDDIKHLEAYQKITIQSKSVVTNDELVSSIQQMLVDQHFLSPQTSAIVKHTMAYIQQNYQDSLSRTEMASAVGVSESYLSQIFYQESGISLWDYLNRYRVHRAKDLLRHTNDSIAYIASQVGFDDPAYFSRVFRRYVGQSPRVFRNKPVS